MKNQLRGHQFKDDDQRKHTVKKVLEGFPAGFFKKGLETLKNQSEECATLDGNYVEN